MEDSLDHINRSCQILSKIGFWNLWANWKGRL